MQVIVKAAEPLVIYWKEGRKQHDRLTSDRCDQLNQRRIQRDDLSGSQVTTSRRIANGPELGISFAITSSPNWFPKIGSIRFLH